MVCIHELQNNDMTWTDSVLPIDSGEQCLLLPLPSPASLVPKCVPLPQRWLKGHEYESSEDSKFLCNCKQKANKDGYLRLTWMTVSNSSCYGLLGQGTGQKMDYLSFRQKL